MIRSILSPLHPEFALSLYFDLFPLGKALRTPSITFLLEFYNAVAWVADTSDIKKKLQDQMDQAADGSSAGKTLKSLHQFLFFLIPLVA